MGAERPVLPAGWPHTAQNGFLPPLHARASNGRYHWSDERRQRFEQMWREGVHVDEIADFFEMSPGSVYSRANYWKLGRRKKPGRPKPVKRRRRRLPADDSTGQRRFTGVSKGGGPKITLEPHDPRYLAGITVFPTTVVPAKRVKRVLKEGKNSRKLGNLFTKGVWAGMPIFMLTLQERATCPRTCKEWAWCYGNNMPFAERIHDDGTLTRRLWGELAALAVEFPNGFVVRLHVLGDFFSVDYVQFWADALDDFPPLRIFGFTARRPNDPIGAALIRLVAAREERFMLRFSGAGYETHCSEVVEKVEQATGLVCPAELEPNRSCATCGLCASSDKTITFIRH